MTYSGQNQNWTTEGTENHPQAGLVYPLVGAGSKDLPVMIQFVARPYESKTLFRSGGGDPKDSTNMAVITLPLPRDVNNSSNASYKTAQLSRGGPTDPNPGEIAEDLQTGGGVVGALGLAAGMGSIYDVAGYLGKNLWLGWLKDSLGVGEFFGEYPMDLRDNVFAGMTFRNHQFAWTFVPKTVDECKRVAAIGAAFTTLLHPTRNPNTSAVSQFVSRVLHPPMWNISVFDTSEGSKGNRNRWLLYPQLCVLSSCVVRTRQTENGPWMVAGEGSNGPWPAATQISCNFLEIEPNINIGSRISNRSNFLNSFDVDGGFAPDDLGL